MRNRGPSVSGRGHGDACDSIIEGSVCIRNGCGGGPLWAQFNSAVIRTGAGLVFLRDSPAGSIPVRWRGGIACSICCKSR